MVALPSFSLSLPPSPASPSDVERSLRVHVRVYSHSNQLRRFFFELEHAGHGSSRLPRRDSLSSSIYLFVSVSSAVGQALVPAGIIILALTLLARIERFLSARVAQDLPAYRCLSGRWSSTANARDILCSPVPPRRGASRNDPASTTSYASKRKRKRERESTHCFAGYSSAAWSTLRF